jgi:hypothetical protein
MTTKCTDPIDHAIAKVKARRGDPCWLCDGLEPIWDSGLCFKCYTWAMANTPQDATEEQIKEAFYKPAMVQRLIAAIQNL